MTLPPPCSALGRQCNALRVTLRVGSLDEGTPSLDHESTWLLGHTERITFLDLWEGEGDLYADAVLHVPCRFLAADGGQATCKAYGFEGPLPRARRQTQPRQLGGDHFVIVEKQQIATKKLLPPPAPKRSLPVVNGVNPCAGAPCTTSDHRRGAACCRDLQVEIMCTRRQTRLEALVRSRRPPYLCKVSREGDFSIEAEMISACAYIEPGGVNCTLHGRVRADGRTAKPDLCFEWPPKRQVLHPGCVFAPRKRARSGA